MSALEWGSLSAFYRERGGQRSGETDFGVWWYAGDDRRGPPYRVSWVQATGDVYAYEQWKSSVILIGNCETHAMIEQLLRGWAEKCGSVGSLDWIHERLELAGKALL